MLVPFVVSVRREGVKLFLKGRPLPSRTSAPLIGARTRPVRHGQRRAKFTEYGIRLREKQKVSRIYGVLERQFRRYFYEADRTRA